MSRRAGATQTEIANLASVIASGRHSPALLAELEKRERRLEEISDELLATDSRGIVAQLKEIEAFVLSSLQNIQERLTGEVSRAKGELAKHCTEITLTPEGKSYNLLPTAETGRRDHRSFLANRFSDRRGGQSGAVSPGQEPVGDRKSRV